jgi:hypothetical protein
MPKTRISCPNCRQPLVAEIEQLFDIGADPSAKQRLLAGSFNVIACPSCGYQGALSTPIVYHDPQKELLLTFIPPEINLPRDEQERLLGTLINQVVNRLQQEQRKGYLLRPQAVLTLKGLVERVLEADGITREVLQAQQEKLNLLQRLMDAGDDVIAEVARQEDQRFDADFFNLINRLVEAAVVSGDQESAQRLADLQSKLMDLTTVGKELKSRTNEIEAAIQLLQGAGKDLTREKLLDLILHAPSETQVDVIASLARPGLDYMFFQLLSERIDRARGAGRDRLVSLRERLLEITRQVDEHNQARAVRARQLLDTILKSENLAQAIQNSLPAIDEFFVQTLEKELETARKIGDLAKIAKLQEISKVIESASEPPPEVALIDELLRIDNDDARSDWLDKHRSLVTPEFIEMLTSLLIQSQSREDEELLHRVQAAYRSALRFSMEANIG